MFPIIEHPNTYLSPSLTDRIKLYAADAEKLGELHPEQLKIIYDQKWFHLFVPKAYGGLELGLPEALHIEESLAGADGSMGWTITLCAGANWFIGFLQAYIAKEIFQDEKACIAGSGKPSGVAKVMDHGYEITGFWKYATGAPSATIFTANCLIEENGSLLENDNGEPLMRSFWFKKDEVIVHKDWNCTGMIATASHSFEVKKLYVPGERSFTIDSEQSVLHHPIYKFPFLQFAETTLTVNISGMAIRFLELCQPIIERRKKDLSTPGNTITDHLEGTAKKLNEARKCFYVLVEKSWNALLLKGNINDDLLKELSAASKALSKIAREAVDDLYPFCGMEAAQADTEINRVWRNIHTASQHSLTL